MSRHDIMINRISISYENFTTRGAFYKAEIKVKL
jgi:hypothetical protein